MEEQLPSVFDEVYENYILAPASAGRRFANYIIDLIAIQCVQYGLGYVVGLVIVAVGGDVEFGETAFLLLSWLIIIAAFLLYYMLIETLTNGKSLGKLLTGTRAVREDGSVITAKDAMKRSLIRLIPFEQLSALSEYPWHDKWTNTIVAKDGDIAEMNKFRLKG